jgi:hypothetical protein
MQCGATAPLFLSNLELSTHRQQSTACYADYRARTHEGTQCSVEYHAYTRGLRLILKHVLLDIQASIRELPGLSATCP